jgi:hypothetical protein
MVSGRIEYLKSGDERDRLRLHPITAPTFGHMAMLPVGTEGALIDLNAEKGGRAIEGFIVTPGFRDDIFQKIKEHGPDTLTGWTVMLYVLPDGYEGPLP